MFCVHGMGMGQFATTDMGTGSLLTADMSAGDEVSPFPSVIWLIEKRYSSRLLFMC